jgi:hypothetical protein
VIDQIDETIKSEGRAAVIGNQDTTAEDDSMRFPDLELIILAIALLGALAILVIVVVRRQQRG